MVIIFFLTVSSPVSIPLPTLCPPLSTLIPPSPFSILSSLCLILSPHELPNHHAESLYCLHVISKP
jgi:hypothetical protein